MKYDKEVLTINDILTALDNFDNKEEIINAIKRSLYDIETDWHHEEYLKQQLATYKQKEDKLREYIDTWVVDEYSIYVLTGEGGCKNEPNAIGKLLQILNEGE